MNRKFSIVRYLIVAAFVIVMVFSLAACGAKSEKSGKSEAPAGEKQEEQKVEAPDVAGKYYVLYGMSSEDEEYDEDLLKEMFGIKDLSEYLSVYFEEGGKAQVYSLVHGRKVSERNWSTEGDKVILEISKTDVLELTADEDGLLHSELVEEDGTFPIILAESKDAPKVLKDVK